MKAIVLVPQLPALPMGQVLDRPFLQHLIEQLVSRGVSAIDFVHGPEMMQLPALAADGIRWGTPIRCHCSPAPNFEEVARRCAREDTFLLTGSALRLPLLPCLAPGADNVWPALYFEQEETKARWSGWTLLPARDAAVFWDCVHEGSDWREASRTAGVSARRLFLERASLSCESAEHLLLSNRRALGGGWPDLYFYGREQTSGVWLARGARVHPRATLQSPCYIGEGTRIEANSTIGPHAVIGSHCFVAKGTTVNRSVISDSAYLGPELDFVDSVVQGNTVFNVRLNCSIEIEEKHIVSEMMTVRNWRRSTQSQGAGGV